MSYSVPTVVWDHMIQSHDMVIIDLLLITLATFMSIVPLGYHNDREQP